MSVVNSTMILLIALSIAVVFVIKHKVKQINKELVHIERMIAIDQEKKYVLQAEWTYLNQPERLKTLANRYLDLKHPSAHQVKEMTILPVSYHTIKHIGRQTQREK